MSSTSFPSFRTCGCLGIITARSSPTTRNSDANSSPEIARPVPHSFTIAATADADPIAISTGEQIERKAAQEPIANRQPLALDGVATE